MLKESFSFTLSLIIDLINADFLVPRSYRKMFTGGGKLKIRNAIFRRRIESDIFRYVAGGVCLARCCRRSADRTEERHSNENFCFSQGLVRTGRKIITRLISSCRKTSKPRAADISAKILRLTRELAMK